jgi:CubicO group peptidase (beta-lactamase class C family)
VTGKDTSTIVEESGFRVALDRSTGFRLADLAPYRQLSGLCLKEMDVGWWDTASQRIFLLELKGSTVWDKFDADKDAAHGHLVATLRDKATDALLLLAAAWIGTSCGAELKALLPESVQAYPGDGKIKLIFLVDTPASRKPLLSAIKDELNRKTAGRSRLFGIRHLTIVDFDLAVKLGLPVTRAA